MDGFFFVWFFGLVPQRVFKIQKTIALIGISFRLLVLTDIVRFNLII
jgi:hypothetical protein